MASRQFDRCETSTLRELTKSMPNGTAYRKHPLISSEYIITTGGGFFKFYICWLHVCCAVVSALQWSKMPKISTLFKRKRNDKTKETWEAKAWSKPNSRSRFCHRFETRYYEKTSGFHSVWLSLCRGFASGINTKWNSPY